MNSDSSRKRKDSIDNFNGQHKLKIPKLIPIKKILASSGCYSGPNCLKNDNKLPAFDDNNNNSRGYYSNQRESQASDVGADAIIDANPDNDVDVQSSAAVIDNVTDCDLSSKANNETNSKKTQTKTRQSFLLITLVDHNRILRVHCHEMSTNTSDDNTNTNSHNNSYSNNRLTLQQSDSNSNSNSTNNICCSAKVISPIRLTKAKDGSWHSKEIRKNAVTDLSIQTEISCLSLFSSEKSYEAEIEFVRNLIQNQEMIAKKPLLSQLNDLKSHLNNYPIRDPMLIPKINLKNLLENPYKGFLKLLLEKPQYYFDHRNVADHFYESEFHNNENNRDSYLITLKTFEEVLKTYDESTKKIKDDVVKSSIKDVDEIDTERTALFNQLTLMKYCHNANYVPPKSLNVNNIGNNFSNVSDQLLKQLFFNGNNMVTSDQQNRIPKFFSSNYNGGKNGARKLSKILDLPRQANGGGGGGGGGSGSCGSGGGGGSTVDYFCKSKNSLEARSAALYDFHL